MRSICLVFVATVTKLGSDTAEFVSSRSIAPFWEVGCYLITLAAFDLFLSIIFSIMPGTFVAEPCGGSSLFNHPSCRQCDEACRFISLQTNEMRFLISFPSPPLHSFFVFGSCWLISGDQQVLASGSGPLGAGSSPAQKAHRLPCVCFGSKEIWALLCVSCRPASSPRRGRQTWQLWAHGALRTVLPCVPVLKPCQEQDARPRENTEEVSPSPARTRGLGSAIWVAPHLLPTCFTFKAISYPGFSAAPHSLKDWNLVLTISWLRLFHPFSGFSSFCQFFKHFQCCWRYTHCKGASQVVQVVKNPPAIGGDIRDVGSIPGLRRSPGGGHGSPLQYSCLENPHGQRRPAGRLRFIGLQRTGHK